MAAGFRLKAPKVAEHGLQKAIADVLRLELAPPGKVSGRGVVWWSTDIANYGPGVPGARIGRGVVAGIPDTFVLYRGELFCIEIKTVDGVLSEAQQWVLAAIRCAGGKIGVARDSAEVTDLLDVWQIPRAHRVKDAPRNSTTRDNPPP